MTTTTRREAGNLYVGDVIVTECDLIGTITALDWVGSDRMDITTTIGRLLGVRFSDLIEVVTPA